MRRPLALLALTLVPLGGCATGTLRELWSALEPRCCDRWVVECDAGTFEVERYGVGPTWVRDGERLEGTWLCGLGIERLQREARQAGLEPGPWPRAAAFGRGCEVLLPRSMCTTHDEPPHERVVLVRDDVWTTYPATVDGEWEAPGNALRWLGRALLVPLFAPAAVLDAISFPALLFALGVG